MSMELIKTSERLSSSTGHGAAAIFVQMTDLTEASLLALEHQFFCATAYTQSLCRALADSSC